MTGPEELDLWCAGCIHAVVSPHPAQPAIYAEHASGSGEQVRVELYHLLAREVRIHTVRSIAGQLPLVPVTTAAGYLVCELHLDAILTGQWPPRTLSQQMRGF